MKTIKVRTPAKINLSLELLNRMNNGYHNIASVMQTVSLYDYITISVQKSDSQKILLSGNSDNIPYDDKNIVYKAAKLFCEKADLKNIDINIFIEKYIPIEAGLAGGSTNGAGTLIALNELFNNILSLNEIHTIASLLGSDLNFCLEGGACLVSSRGEIIEEKLPFHYFNVVILKPKNIAVSTKLCYQTYDIMYNQPKTSLHSKKIAEIFKNRFTVKELSKYLYNDLELAVKDIYPELDNIKNLLKDNGAISSIMTGSGSAVFGIFQNKTNISVNNNIQCYNVTSIPNGVEII